MKNKLAVSAVLVAVVVFILSGGADARKAAEPEFKTPVITLEMFEVPQYDGYWYYAASVEPTRGEAGDRGAPLPLSFLFNIENPNDRPLMLESLQMTIAFDDDFEAVTFSNQDVSWIPAGKTNQLRVTTMITARSMLLSLLVTGGFKLKEMGVSPWDVLERWWVGVPEYSVPVSLKESVFYFVFEGQTKVVPFEAEFP